MSTSRWLDNCFLAHTQIQPLHSSRWGGFFLCTSATIDKCLFQITNQAKILSKFDAYMNDKSGFCHYGIGS